LIYDLKICVEKTLASGGIVPKIINFLIEYKFFKLQILLKLIPNYGEYMGGDM